MTSRDWLVPPWKIAMIGVVVCGLSVLAGAEALDPEQPDERLQKERNRIPLEQRLACRAGLHGDVTATAAYW